MSNINEFKVKGSIGVHVKWWRTPPKSDAFEKYTTTGLGLIREVYVPDMFRREVSFAWWLCSSTTGPANTYVFRECLHGALVEIIRNTSYDNVRYFDPPIGFFLIDHTEKLPKLIRYNAIEDDEVFDKFREIVARDMIPIEEALKLRQL